VDAVVMAAGEGTRLRPLTEAWPKPMLPVDGRPVVVTLLHELWAAALGPVTVVTGYRAEQLKRLLAGLDLRFVRQPRADGSADAVHRALEGGAQLPAVVVAADTVFTEGDPARFAAAFAASGYAGALAWRAEPPPGPGRAALGVEGDRLVRVLDRTPGNPRSAAPLWGVGPELAQYVAAVQGPPFELAQAFQDAIDDGLPVLASEIGRTRDLTYPVDLVKENFPYLKAIR
jgi:NDP-sugar pyrophosphorylase family protein